MSKKENGRRLVYLGYGWPFVIPYMFQVVKWRLYHVVYQYIHILDNFTWILSYCFSPVFFVHEASCINCNTIYMLWKLSQGEPGSLRAYNGVTT